MSRYDILESSYTAIMLNILSQGKKSDYFSFTTPLTSLSVEYVAQGHLIEHIIEGSNVINVRFKPKMNYEMSHGKLPIL